jgi:hypothetical protein
MTKVAMTMMMMLFLKFGVLELVDKMCMGWAEWASAYLEKS